MKRSALAILLILTCLMAGCASHIEDGTEYLKKEQYEKAIACFEKDIEKDKNLDEAYRGIGIAQYELESYPEALEAFEKAIEHETKETATLYGLIAACHMYAEDYEAALEAYGKVLEMKDCTDEMRQEARFNEIAICQRLSDWELTKDKVASYVADYPDDSRMDKTAEFLETR